MKIRLLLLAITFFLFSNLNFLFSQLESETSPLEPGFTTSRIYLGPVAGYNRSLHTVDLSSFAEDPLCPFFTNGSGNGFYVGAFYEQFIGGINSKHSLVLKVLYNVLPASFTKEGDTYPSQVEDPNDPNKTTIVYSSTKHSVNVDYNMLSFDIMYKFRVAGGVVLTVGPSFDFPITKNLQQKYELIEPNYVKFKRDEDAIRDKGYQYINNDRTIIVYDGDIGRTPQENSAGFRFGLKGGVQYEIITGNIFDIIPGVFYNLGLTNATDAQSWKVNALQIGVDIRFAL